MVNANPGSALTSGQLAVATGVSADTIRHYEKIGLLAKAARSGGGYRLYDPNAANRVQTIRSAVKAGFSLAELSGIFKERDAGGAPCHRVTALAANKLNSLERQIEELTELKDWLATTVSAWQKRLEDTPAGERAGLLESLGRQAAVVNNHAPRGTVNEDDHSHIRFMAKRRSSHADNHAVSHARPAPRGQ
jgi:DNA-binding transcriptional MerR regulator